MRRPRNTSRFSRESIRTERRVLTSSSLKHSKIVSLGNYVQQHAKSKRNNLAKTRIDGVKQVGRAIATQNPVIAAVDFAKDLTIGSYKIVDPKGFKKDKIARKIDEL